MGILTTKNNKDAMVNSVIGEPEKEKEKKTRRLSSEEGKIFTWTEEGLSIVKTDPSWLVNKGGLLP